MFERAWYWRVIELVWQVAFYTCPVWMDWVSWAKYLLPFCKDYTALFRITTTVAIMLTWFTGSVYYGTLYYLQRPSVEKYRIQEWVWNKEDSERKRTYMKILNETIFDRLLIGQFFSTPASMYFAFGISEARIDDINAYFDSYNLYEQTWKLAIAFVFFDTFFYWAHRYLHTPSMYKHHKEHHAYYVPTHVAGLWGSAIDGLLSLPLPAIVPIFLLNMHVFTMILWLSAHSLRSMYDHCGYNFPFDWTQLVPFGCDARLHNFHHSHNTGNYALLYPIWDQIMGTDISWNKYNEELQKVLTNDGVETSDLVTMKDGVLLVKGTAEENDIANGEDLLFFKPNDQAQDKAVNNLLSSKQTLENKKDN